MLLFNKLCVMHWMIASVCIFELFIDLLAVGAVEAVEAIGGVVPFGASC